MKLELIDMDELREYEILINSQIKKYALERNRDKFMKACGSMVAIHRMKEVIRKLKNNDI